MQRIINGIQQVGIGVADAAAAFEWYKKYFHFDTVVFEDVAKATLMHRYTGGEVHQRYAVLAMNMQGGGGFEIWQYTSRTPQPAKEPLLLGDLGIFAIKIKCRDVAAARRLFIADGLHVLTDVAMNPLGQKHFFIKDPFGNLFQIMEDDWWFQKKASLMGGVCGAVIGVSDLERSIPFYQSILDYTSMQFKSAETFEDLKDVPGGNVFMQRAILKNNPSFCGAFSKLLGPTTIELVEVENKPAQKIYEDRYWGDLGFIHICYDLCAMPAHQSICERGGQPLTVNSGTSFEMGKAAGQFAYNEDPDGTLIEYVETHKVPILKKLGWYLDLRNRKQHKPLPDWMVRCMGWSKKSLQMSQSYLTCTQAQAVKGNEINVANAAPPPKKVPEITVSKSQ